MTATATPAPYSGFPVVLFYLTSDEFLRLPESEYPLELIDGAVLMAAKPPNSHQRFLLHLALSLDAWVEKHRLGRVFPDCGVRLSDNWMPAPDLSFLAAANLHRDRDEFIDGPVDLAVEVLSPGNVRMDRVTKFAAFAGFGVGWYWIIDRDARTLEEYENVAGTFQLVASVPFSTTFQPRLFPGLVIDLAAL